MYWPLGQTLWITLSHSSPHIDVLLRISGVSGEGSGVKVEGSPPITEAVSTPTVADTKAAAAEDDDDDDVDLFGEETEEEKKAAEERAGALKASGKKKESGKSSVLLDVKPWDDNTDMKKLKSSLFIIIYVPYIIPASLSFYCPVQQNLSQLDMNQSISTFRAAILWLSTKYESVTGLRRWK
ncbi:hypothetical protein K7X08_034741 [Anisodus acutangulus]|uniref:Translation elongation factor EF1B beta/delta subunit guanine nucleotide exchange domain-containing protein n=1 Tax=Anisodus acutangulus TaxID=402998 RepID=A0A9Q1QZY8_9SOLA|nr:hypothetical protein K7X08_034741 [Anisodus acutangulus]